MTKVNLPIERVKISTSPDKFHLLPMNRPIMPHHTTKLVRSCKYMGVIRAILVIKTSIVDGKEKMYIVDGQHLYTGLVRLNSNIPYIIMEHEINDIEDIIKTISLLNTSSKGWTLNDFVYCWNYFENDYRLLIKQHKLYNISFNNLCIINKSSISELKLGEFRMRNPEADNICKYCSDLLDLLPAGNRWINSRFITNFVKFYDSKYYNHVNIKKRVLNYKGELSLIVSEDALTKFFKTKLFI